MLNKTLIIAMLFTFSAFNAESQTNPAECIPPKVKEGALCVETVTKNLVDSGNPITIKIYIREASGKTIDRTFVVVHNNEQKGLNAVKEVLSEKDFYGRLVEVVSNYEEGFNLKETINKRRYLHFGNGKYCIDPNRIYSVKGRTDALKDSKCSGTPRDSETNNAVKLFADSLLNIVTLNNTHKFIIGVHNNTIHDEITNKDDLTLKSWSGKGPEAKTALGIFTGNKHGKNGKPGSAFDTVTDDFVLVTNGYLAGQFLDNRIHSVALQEGKDYLIDNAADADDGSMSVYFGMTLFGNTDKPFSYINIEAGGKPNTSDIDKSKKWQKEIIRMVITKMKPLIGETRR
jgi:hypothetical protein